MHTVPGGEIAFSHHGERSVCDCRLAFFDQVAQRLRNRSKYERDKDCSKVFS